MSQNYQFGPGHGFNSRVAESLSDAVNGIMFKMC